MGSVKSGWRIYKSILKFILRKPFMLLPMLCAWAVYVGVAYWFNLNFDTEVMTTAQLLLLFYGFTALSTFTIAISSLFILELLEQHETTGRMNPIKALIDMITKDFWRALPIIFVWSLVDFVLALVISMLNSTRKSKNRPRRPKGPLQLAVEAFRDMVRLGSMVVFTVIAWEPIGPKDAFDKGMKVYKEKFAMILTGFGLNKITSLLLSIPVLIGVTVMQAEIVPIDTIVIIYVVYSSIVWSLGKLIEQLYVSEMYLWYKHFEKAKELAKQRGEEGPKTMSDVPKPSFQDNKFDLKREY